MHLLKECLLSKLSVNHSKLLTRPLPMFGYLRLLLHELLCPQWVLTAYDEWSAMCGMVNDICYPLSQLCKQLLDELKGHPKTSISHHFLQFFTNLSYIVVSPHGASLVLLTVVVVSPPPHDHSHWP